MDARLLFVYPQPVTLHAHSEAHQSCHGVHEHLVVFLVMHPVGDWCTRQPLPVGLVPALPVDGPHVTPHGKLATQDQPL